VQKIESLRTLNKIEQAQLCEDKLKLPDKGVHGGDVNHRAKKCSWSPTDYNLDIYSYDR